MCGIAGVVSKDKSRSSSFLNTALIELNLRGPDDSGIYEDNLVSLGMTRLEILDPIGGKQPMTHSNRYVLVYNGQIYNHLDLRIKLPNYKWKSHSDTETLLVLLVNFGTDILSELNGMFSFAFWDKEKFELILARDGSGEKPLYYAIENQTLWFASTADALKKSISQELEINYEAVSVMLNTGFIPPSKSVYKNVTQLRAGNYLLYKGHHLSTVNFISPSQITTTTGASGDFLEILNSVVDKQSTADVKVGLFLSGGLDSSLLAHILHNQKGKFDSFTAKLLNNSADIQAANIVAKKLGLNHHEVDIKDGDIYQLLTKQAKFFDEPFGDSAAIPLIAISEIAKSQVGVCLSGDGADELFAGYGWKFRPLIESG
jgi:asparagine synthase (glutamine-hydrolysing)